MIELSMPFKSRDMINLPSSQINRQAKLLYSPEKCSDCHIAPTPMPESKVTDSYYYCSCQSSFSLQHII